MPEPKSVLDRLEENARYVVASEDMFMSVDGRELLSLIAVARAAQRYRAVGLADPTALDLPPAGADLDRAIRSLTRDSDA